MKVFRQTDVSGYYLNEEFSNMTKFHLTIYLVLTFISFSAGQTKYITRDSVHIFWQPDLKITAEDYLGKPTDEVLQVMNQFGFRASASVGIWSVLDIPKKKNDRYKKFEKVYFAPAFDRSSSYTQTKDSLEIAVQNTYLDICEIWARWARKKLYSLRDSTNSTGTLTIFYKTIEYEMDSLRLEMYRDYTQDVIINKRPEAFQEWRTLINEALMETEKYATTPEECYRLLSGNPTEEGYIKAPTVIGVLKN